MFSIVVFYFGQVICCNSKRDVMLDCGFSPLMSSLSDRNTRGCVVATRDKTTVLVLAGARIVYFTQSSFMQLSVALDLHFGWDSQLNTSEMFWIDILRWIIHSRCRWISVYLPWRTAHAFEPLPFFCSIVSIAVRF